MLIADLELGHGMRALTANGRILCDDFNRVRPDPEAAAIGEFALPQSARLAS